MNVKKIEARNYGRSQTKRRSQMQLPRRLRGQSIVVIALAMIALIGLVGLAVDGGNAYLQRRNAQNGADAAALAGARQMLTVFENTTWQSDGTVVDGTSDDEQDIYNEIMNAASANGVVTSTLIAYFVNDNKQLVSAMPVGQFGGVPFVAGTKGILVKAESKTDSYFLKVIGYKTVGASAQASAYMGPAVDQGMNAKLVPLSFYTDTDHLRSMVNGRTYTLIAGNKNYTSGTWGYLDFNGQGSNTTIRNAWLACGYDPRISTDAEWSSWCHNSHYNGVGHATGPTQYWTGWPNPDLTTTLYAPSVEWKGIDASGPDWWIQGATGVSSSCSYFRDLLHSLTDPQYLVPVFDAYQGGGSNTYMHLLAIIVFQFNRDDVDCHGINQDWSINGQYVQVYTPGAGGRHGDLLHTSLHAVFLEP